MQTRRQRRGMTLMEVMIVIAIITLLTGALTFALNGIYRQAKRSTAELQAGELAKSAMTYEIARRKPLEDLSMLAGRAPIDPWGSPYELDPRESVTSLAEDRSRGGQGYDEDIVASIRSGRR